MRCDAIAWDFYIQKAEVQLHWWRHVWNGFSGEGGEPPGPGSIQADLGDGQLGFVEGILSVMVALWDNV